MNSPQEWPVQGANDITTASCGICGAIYGVRYGESDNPTDNRTEHLKWHSDLNAIIAQIRKEIEKWKRLQRTFQKWGSGDEWSR